MLGLALGMGAGLYYTWVIDPIEYVDTAPRTLRQDFREDYLALIATAYSATGDLPRARARLALFPDVDPITDLAELAQRRLAAGLPSQEAAALSDLSAVMGRSPERTPTAPPLAEAAPSRTPLPSPDVTTSPTPDAPFRIDLRQRICDPLLTDPLIQVEVFDQDGDPVRGVEVFVSWDGGEDRFVTGLKPEFGLAYGDFQMTDGIVYTVELGELTADNLQVHDCKGENGVEFPGSWYVRFEAAP